MGFEQAVAALAVTCHVSGITRDEEAAEFAEWVKTRPEEFRPLYIGPIPALTNYYVTYGLMNSGSRYGYETYHAHQAEMKAFCEFFDGADVVCLEFGADYRREYESLSAVYGEEFEPKLEP